jgi:hypothetical protein
MLEEEGNCSSKTEIEGPSTLQDLPNNRFLTVDEAYKAVTSAHTTITQKIPTGPKSNVFVLLKANKESKYEFPDDCGVWGRSGTTVNSIYSLQDNKLRTVVLRNNVYCVEKKVQGQRTFLPLEPQPIDDTIIKTHRYYTKLKTDDGYLK